MLDHCAKFGLDHSINFNHAKTQFLISGTSRINSPFLYLNNKRIPPAKNNELTHLGFRWKLNNNHYLSLTLKRLGGGFRPSGFSEITFFLQMFNA